VITYHGDLDLRLIRAPDGRALTEGGRSRWRVLGEPWADWNGVQHYLERDSETNMGSMPRLVWTLLPPDGAWTLPAAFHDDGYRKRGDVARLNHPEPFTREEVDKMFLAGMKAMGVSKLKRTVIFNAVRAGGKKGWGS
jgi:hypothetical protein